MKKKETKKEQVETNEVKLKKWSEDLKDYIHSTEKMATNYLSEHECVIDLFCEYALGTCKYDPFNAYEFLNPFDYDRIEKFYDNVMEWIPQDDEERSIVVGKTAERIDLLLHLYPEANWFKVEYVCRILKNWFNTWLLIDNDEHALEFLNEIFQMLKESNLFDMPDTRYPEEIRSSCVNFESNEINRQVEDIKDIKREFNL